jgi:hypothetical protein
MIGGGSNCSFLSFVLSKRELIDSEAGNLKNSTKAFLLLFLLCCLQTRPPSPQPEEGLFYLSLSFVFFLVFISPP